MKYIVVGAAFACVLGLFHTATPVQAQDQNVRTICANKYLLSPREMSSASEQRRKESAAKFNACVRSGGKS